MIEVRRNLFPKLISETLELTPDMEGQNLNIELPYIFKRSYRGAVIVRPPKNDISNPLDLPEQDLINLIRGHIYLEEHFNGQSLRSLSMRDGATKRTIANLINSVLLGKSAYN